MQSIDGVILVYQKCSSIYNLARGKNQIFFLLNFQRNAYLIWEFIYNIMQFIQPKLPNISSSYSNWGGWVI